MSKKVLYILFSILVLAALVTACSPNNAATPEEPVQEEAPANNNEANAPAEESEAEEPVVEEEPAEPVVIDWHFIPQAADEATIEAIEAEISAIAQARGVNAQIDLVTYDWGNFNEKVPLMLTTGEECDLVYTASWINTFSQRVADGTLLPLNELMAEQTPDLLDKFPQGVWNSVSVDGNIYGVPNQQIWATPFGVAIRQDILEKYPLDWDSIGTGTGGMKDLIPYMEMVMENEPQLAAFFDNGGGINVGPLMASELWGHTRIDATAVVDADNPDVNVVSEVFMDEYLEQAKVIREYYEKGLLMEEAISAEEASAKWEAGEYAAFFHVWKPEIYGVPLAANGGYAFDGKVMVQTILGTDGITGTLTSVCQTSPNPEVALQVIELASSDAEFFNALVYGVEGTHWNWVDEGKKVIGMVDDMAAPLFNWMMGDTFLGYYTDPLLAENDVWVQTQTMNDNAVKAVTMGFVFDPAPVEAEIAQVKAVSEEYGLQITMGTTGDVDAAVAEYREMLLDAGIETVLAEVQSQIDAWLAAQ